MLQTFCIDTKTQIIYSCLLPRYTAILSQGTFSTFRIHVMGLNIMADNNEENSASSCKSLAFCYPLQQAHDSITFCISQQSDGSLNLLISTEVIFARFYPDRHKLFF